MAWAEANGKYTLEMTPGGEWLNKLDLYGPNSPITSLEVDHLWRAASSQFAKSASGELNAFTAATLFNREKIFYGIEMKQLSKNPNVTLPLTHH